MKNQLNVKLGARTIAQIKALAAQRGESQANVIAIAIDRMAREERETMSSITIGTVDTVPQYDPYRRTGAPSRTVVELDPARRLVTVDQEYDTCATTFDRWNGVVLTWWVDGHPQEEDMRQWINDHMEQLAAICDGHTVEWDGNNHVGRMTEAASAAHAAIDEELTVNWPPVFDRELGWSLWDSRDWLQDAPPEWSPVGLDDDQLETLANEIKANARVDRVILYGTLKYLTSVRDDARDDD